MRIIQPPSKIPPLYRDLRESFFIRVDVIKGSQIMKKEKKPRKLSNLELRNTSGGVGGYSCGAFDINQYTADAITGAWDNAPPINVQMNRACRKMGMRDHAEPMILL
jgi:hypothetical protein